MTRSLQIFRANNFPHIDRTTFLQRTEMLADCNPFMTIYKTARERLRDQQTNFRILLNPQMRLVIESGADRLPVLPPCPSSLLATLLKTSVKGTSKFNACL